MTNVNTTEPVSETTDPEVTAVNEAVISVEDLYNAVKIIDASAQRGVWKGEELSFVGGIRDKIVKFLQPHLVPADENADPAAATTEVPEEVAGPVAPVPGKAKPKAKPKSKK